MKKLLFSAFLSLSAYFSYAQVPNAGMEFWDNQPILLFWETNSRPLTLPPWEPYIIRKDTDSHSGNYAANFYGNGIFKPYATSTFPVSYRPVNLSLYYKLNFAPCVNDVGHPEKDTVSVSVELLHNGTVVDNGYWESIAETSSYTKLVIPISQNAATFDSCRITILGGKVLGGCGFIPESTQFRVDHLELKYSSQSGCIDSSLICGTCACITLYDPVCGCDGNTYGNSCEAYNAGLTSWSQGTCSPPNRLY